MKKTHVSGACPVCQCVSRARRHPGSPVVGRALALTVIMAIATVTFVLHQQRRFEAQRRSDAALSEALRTHVPERIVVRRAEIPDQAVAAELGQ